MTVVYLKVIQFNGINIVINLLDLIHANCTIILIIYIFIMKRLR